MYDSTSIQLRDQVRAEIAAKVSAYEAQHGPVETLPIRIDDKQVPFRIACPEKPRAKAQVKPKPSRALRQLDSKRAAMNSARKTRALQRLETIRQMAARGAKVTEMADATGIAATSVMRLIREHNIPRGPKMDLEAMA